jgi:predicted nucleic acid-binding protein
MPTLHVAEPVLPYARRPLLVVDASVLAAVLFAEPTRTEAEARLRGCRLCAPVLVDFEIANVALQKGRAQVLRWEEIERAWAAFASLDLTRQSVDPAAMTRVAERHRLTAYDAAYLCVAEAMEAPLATFDVSLAKAARRHLGGEGTRES